MKQIIQNAWVIIALLLMPYASFGQAPNLGSTSSFAAFTAAGAFNNLGTTIITGDIGTHVGAFSGFPPGIVFGSIHVADAVSAQAALDVDVAYGELSSLTCGAVIGVTLGNGQLLVPNIYCTLAAATLNGNLTLDAQGDPDALFIFQIDGAFATSTFASVTLINGASLCNVYWQINGEFDLGDFSTFMGTVIVNGAITLLEGSSLTGRILSRQGAISLFSNTITIGLPAVAAVISASGPTSFCIGGSVTLSGNVDGIWSTGETTPSITVSTSGDYFVTNTTVCGSETSNHIIVTENPLPICFITGNLFICEGQTTDLCAPPGNTYLWSTGAMTECITVSVSGLYMVTIIDLNGCTSSCSATVTVAPLPVCSITGDLSICEGETTDLCATPGLSGYVWSTGAVTECITVNASGIYTVVVTDANGCSSTCNVTVVVNPLPVCAITGDLSICEGETTELCATPGLAGYLWNNGATTNCITVSLPGLYSVVITDANGCSSTCNVTVVTNLPPVCSITGDLTICEGETTDLCASPGLAGYLWSTGAITECITVNASGIYTVMITDANGCTSTCSATVTVNLLPVCSITGNLLLCDVGQTTELCAPPGYTYLWSTGAVTDCITVTAGLYSVVITDANGCSSTCSATVTFNPLPVCTITGDLLLCEGASTELCVPPGASAYVWSTGATTNCITVNLPGVYSVIITEANGCSSTCSVTVVVNPLPVCTITGNLTICEGGTTELCATPGLSSYLWNTGATTDCITVSLPGVYSVVITDANGCSSTCNAMVTVNLPPVCSITGNLSLCDVGQTTELCAPPGYTYLWSTGAVTDCIIVDVAGVYTVMITDANGCSSTCSATVTFNPLPVCTITGDLLLCEGATTQLCVPPGATFYSWSTGAMTNCITVSFPGTYSVVIIEANGCSSTCSATVVANVPPVCAITGDLTICEGGTTELCASPGLLGYLWSTGETTNCITVNASGIYTLTVIDANGCSSTCSATVTFNPLPVCSITGDLTICEGETTELCATPGLSSYLWNTGATTDCITVSLPGVYSVIITDLNGCSSTCSATVTVNLLPVCSITGDLLLCGPGQTAELCAPLGYTYLWNTGATTNCITVSSAGIYSVVLMDLNGCSSTCSVTVMVDDTPPVITCPADLTVDCEELILPSNTGTATASGNCGLPVTVVFSDLIMAGTCPQEYTITRTWTATDIAGNSVSCIQTITVVDNTPPTITCPPNLSVECAIQVPAVNVDFVFAFDNCGGIVTVIHVGDVITNQTCENNYTLTRTYRATDACGNTATCDQVITVLDDTQPVITFLTDFLAGDTLSVQCFGQNPDWDIPSYNEGSVQATDNCTGPVSVAFHQVLQNEGNCEEDGFINLYRLTWIATDLCGNSDSATVFLALVDTIPPVIYGVPQDTTVNCSEIPEAPFGIYAIDECLCACLVLLEETTLAPGCPFGQVIVRSWRATDRCGNVTIVSQNITLTDDEGPVITGVLDTACINDPNLYAVVATDKCGGPTTLVYQDINIPNPCGSGVAIRRTYEAYDACGNVSRDTAILLLNDQSQLNLVFLDAVLAALDSGEVLTLEYAQAHTNGHYTSYGVNDVRLEDACLSGGYVSFTERVLEIGDCTVDGYMVLIELKWTATDVCGNETELTVIVQMIDETSPVFVNFIPEMTIGCDEALPEIFSSDNSDGAVFMTMRDTTIRGDCPFEYDINREITLRDSCGNSATRLQIIHVRDDRGPVIQGVVEEVCDDLSIPVVTAYDICSETFVAVTMEADTLDVPCNGLSVIRTWTAVGICGHVTQIRQTITMNDHTPPEIIIPAGSVMLPFLDDDHHLILSSQIHVIENLNDLDEQSVIILDDCDQDIIPVLTIKITFPEDCEAAGYSEHRVYMWMATDACGNMGFLTFSVDIMDDLPPGFSETPADVTVICAPLPLAPEVHAVDQSQPATMTYSETIVPGGSPGEFIVTRTWVATDACGNTATYVQHITWIPDTFLTCTIILPENVECNSHGVIISSEVTGGQGPITYEWQVVGEKCFIQGGQGTPEIIIYVGWSTVKIILTVTDAYGCASMCMILLPCVTSTGDLSADLPPATNTETGDPQTGTPTPGQGIMRRANQDLQQVKLWPNPASESVTLSFEASKEEEVAFSFSNTLGQVLISDKIKAHKGLNTYKIDAAQASNGTHLVQLKTEREVHTKVIVIMRNN